MSGPGHRHPSPNPILSNKAARFSNDTLEVPQPTSLLQTPPELVIHILLYLSPHDIISCARTCRMLHGLCSCPELRYLVQLERCAVIDDMYPGLSYPERLRILESREEAWAKLDFRGSIQVSLSFEPTGIYDFTDGVLILGMGPSNADHQLTVGYSYISLPSLSDSQDKTLEWRRCNLETDILDFGLAAHEHDLIAVLTMCVFPSLLFTLTRGFDLIEAKLACVIHLRRLSWKYIYLAFQLVRPIPLQRNPISPSPQKAYLSASSAPTLKSLVISSFFLSLLKAGVRMRTYSSWYIGKRASRTV
jgi:hypothetical protein